MTNLLDGLPGVEPMTRAGERGRRVGSGRNVVVCSTAAPQACHLGLVMETGATVPRPRGKGSLPDTCRHAASHHVGAESGPAMRQHGAGEGTSEIRDAGAVGGARASGRYGFRSATRFPAVRPPQSAPTFPVQIAPGSD